MGNFIRLNKWLNKPTWGDFIALMIGWGLLLGVGIVGLILSTESRPTWQTILFVLLLLLTYVVMFYSSYYHVKKHRNNDRKKSL